jgi:hypothetical protein
MILRHWPHSLRSNVKAFRASRRRNGPSRSAALPGVESLEDRRLLSVNLQLGFAGLNTNDAGGIIEPPDTIAAAGPTAVVELVNSNIAFYGKSDGSQLFSEGLDVFFSPVDPTPFLLSDVSVTYDEQVGRFFVSSMDIDFNTLTSYFDFAVSNDSNPLDGFTEMHRIDTTEISPRTGEPLFTDFPRLGWNADAYVLSFNMFGFQTQNQYNTQLLIIQKSTVLDQNNATLSYYQVDRPLPNSTLVPATMHGSSAGGPMWFVEEKGLEQDGSYANLRVVKMTNVLSGSPTFTDYYVPVAAYTITPFPSDTVGTVSTALDTRILNLDWRNNQMVAAQDVGIASDTDVHAQWYEIATGGTAPALVQQGTLSPGAGIDTYMPSVALGTDGSIGMTYIESSSAEDMSMYVTGRLASDPAGTMQTGVLAKTGEQNYQGTRIGDFSGITVDPSTGTTYWAANEYAIATTDPSLPNWGTWIANFGISSTSASFIAADTTTQGTWKGVYGADGYNVLGNASSYPSYATVTASGQSNWTWAGSTTDVRALQKATAGASDRIAACWYASSQFTVDLNLTDGQTHEVSLYAVDWDSTTRSETVQVVDATTGTVLDTQTLSSFHNGTYLSWNISGHVVFRFTQTGGANAVLSGLFFGGAPTSTSTAKYLFSDATTQGNWKSVYGADGYTILGDVTSYPSYVTVTPSNQSAWTWEASTTDLRGLQKADPGATDRIAACWFGSQFSVDVNLTDGKTHQITLYATDWDTTNRAETIQIVDEASGKVLDTESISSFHNGIYLSWNISGNVVFNFAVTGGANAVVNGFFFGGPTTGSGSATFLSQDTTTQGSWKGVYGTDGYNVINDLASNPSYATVTPSGQSSWTWAASTTDVRGLQKVDQGATDRIAACWYGSQFSFDVNLTDGKSHKISIYACDWDFTTRAETIQVLDAKTGKILDTESLSSFHNGIYLSWNISGNVIFVVTQTGSPNAVVNGLFFG